MLTADDGSNDGRKIGYLKAAGAWRGFDPPLFSLLEKILTSDHSRNISCLEASGLLPGVRFFSQELDDSASRREQYMIAAQQALQDCNLTFFDPDNGIEVTSVKYGARKSSRYLYWKEIRQAFQSGTSLLIYQHFNRQPRKLFIDRISQELRLQTNSKVVAAIYSAHVVFFFVGHPEHEESFNRVSLIIERRWKGQLQVFQNTSIENDRPLLKSLALFPEV